MTFTKDNSVECKDKTWFERVKVRTGAGKMRMKSSNYKLLFVKGYRYGMSPGKDVGSMRSFVVFLKMGDIACLYPRKKVIQPPPRPFSLVSLN